jgi:hypothetical protein
VISYFVKAHNLEYTLNILQKYRRAVAPTVLGLVQQQLPIFGCFKGI